MVVALGALILAALGLLRPVGDDTADTITTRDQSRPASGTLAPVPTPAPSPSSTATSGARPAVPPPADTGTAPETPPPTPTPAQGATELPPRTADATACHPSHDPCVPVDDDVDCAEGTEEVTGDDVSGLDADHDGQGCE
jgi:hypothetical protein